MSCMTGPLLSNFDSHSIPCSRVWAIFGGFKPHPQISLLLPFCGCRSQKHSGHFLYQVRSRSPACRWQKSGVIVLWKRVHKQRGSVNVLDRYHLCFVGASDHRARHKFNLTQLAIDVSKRFLRIFISTWICLNVNTSTHEASASCKCQVGHCSVTRNSSSSAASSLYVEALRAIRHQSLCFFQPSWIGCISPTGCASWLGWVSFSASS